MTVPGLHLPTEVNPMILAGSFLKLVARISYLPNDNQNTSVRCDIITGFLSRLEPAVILTIDDSRSIGQ
jgi:hypothetical protein